MMPELPIEVINTGDGGYKIPGARFDVGVGPLRFGMTPAEVAQVLSCEPQPRAGGPYGEEGYPNGVRAFYDAESLACVALDAVVGPQRSWPASRWRAAIRGVASSSL